MTAGGKIDVLIPTCKRACALAVTLTALAGQTFRDMRLLVADQSEDSSPFDAPEVAAVLRFLAVRGIQVETLRNLPRRGMAEQRAFLLARVTAPYCLFLDDDVIVEHDLVERLHRAMSEQQCGFVGSALHGLSYLNDVRPHEQHIEFWDDKVVPEQIQAGSPAWERHHLHSAANLFHLQSTLGLAATRCYRVAWVGGCVLFDTAKLRAVGGFDFWLELPPNHCGEDVLAQLRVMERFGGCGIIPSGAFHMELATTIAARQFDAPKLLGAGAQP